MTSRFMQVGFSSRIKMEWLEQTARMVLNGFDDRSIYNMLQHILEDKLSVGSNAKRGNREKAITILMKIWVRTPPELIELKKDALKLFSELSEELHISLHWGMALAVYPFWGAVASHTGRLLRLQGTASHAQVRRRIMEKYGDRPTVKHAVRRVLRSMIDWGVLRDDKNLPEGVYRQGEIIILNDERVLAWMIEALLYTYQSDSVSFRTLLNAPQLFPFRFKNKSLSHIITSSKRLELYSNSYDYEMIRLCK